MKRAGVCAVALVVVASCGGDDACPSGSVASGDRCVVVDASVADAGDTGPRDMGPADAAVDEGAPDAGPCGMECSGATAVCDAVGGMCVQCTDADATACAGTATPACDTTTGMCAECTTADAAACTGATPVCDTTSNTCVGCVGNADCTTAGASVCNLTSHTCEPCTAAPGCAHLSGLAVCDSGTCVQCTGTDRAACATGICFISSSTCAPPGGATALCGACVADAECRVGQLCVPMTYDDPSTSPADPVAVGSNCLWREDAAGAGGPAGDCLTVRPYRRGELITTVDAVSARVCALRVSTCEAQADFDMQSCTPIGERTSCGRAGVPDGVCQMASAVANRCTAYCLSDDDCPAGSTCDASTTPRQCAF